MTTIRVRFLLLAALLALPAAGWRGRTSRSRYSSSRPTWIRASTGTPTIGPWCPTGYAIGMDELMDTERGHGMNHDLKNMDVKVRSDG